MKYSTNTSRQLVKFLIIGTANTALDFFIYALLTRSFVFFADHYLLAAAVAFSIAGANSFLWNKKWTFRDTSAVSRTQILRFYAASGVGLVVNQFVLWASVWAITAVAGESPTAYSISAVENADLIGKLCASAAAAGVNFIMQKKWTFSHANTQSNTSVPK